MRRTQVYLSEKQHTKLARLSRKTKLGKSELIRRAVDQLTISSEVMPDWKEAILSAAGIWKDRPEVEDELKQVRAEMDRSFDQIRR
jgi:Ribbon-helix-helix domain